MYQIYILLFESGHYYIGRSKNYQTRYVRHRSDLLLNRHPNRFMQSVHNLYGLPKCILLTYCIDCYAIEQIFINYHHGKDKCLNLSSNSKGGDGIGKNYFPVTMRDDSIRCNIKTKDIPNITKLAKILPVKKIAAYYKVYEGTVRKFCKKYGIEYRKESPGKGINTSLQLQEKDVSQLVADVYIGKLTDSELASMYGVHRRTIENWRKVYQIDRLYSPTKNRKYIK